MCSLDDQYILYNYEVIVLITAKIALPLTILTVKRV